MGGSGAPPGEPLGRAYPSAKGEDATLKAWRHGRTQESGLADRA